MGLMSDKTHSVTVEDIVYTTPLAHNGKEVQMSIVLVKWSKIILLFSPVKK